MFFDYSKIYSIFVLLDFRKKKRIRDVTQSFTIEHPLVTSDIDSKPLLT